MEILLPFFHAKMFWYYFCFCLNLTHWLRRYWRVGSFLCAVTTALMRVDLSRAAGDLRANPPAATTGFGWTCWAWEMENSLKSAQFHWKTGQSNSAQSVLTTGFIPLEEFPLSEVTLLQEKIPDGCWTLSSTKENNWNPFHKREGKSSTTFK